MARSTQDIIFNVTLQTVEIFVWQPRIAAPLQPSAGAVSVFAATAGDDDTAEWTAVGTVDTPNTTVDAASGDGQANPRRLAIASTAGLQIGRKYLLKEESMYEWVEPQRIVTNDFIECRHALKNAYTTAATLQSTYITAVVDATWIADEANISEHIDPDPGWRVRWDVTAGGITYIEYDYFDVVRGLVVPKITIDDVAARWRGLVDSLGPAYRVDRGRSVLLSATRILRSQLHAIDVNDAALRESDVIDEYATLIATRLFAQGGNAPPGWEVRDFYVVAKDLEDKFYERHFLVTSHHNLARGSSGAADSSAAPVALWEK